MKLHLLVLALLGVIASACGATTGQRTAEATEPAVVPLAAVQQEVAGKPVVYLFTAPGCESCAAEARALEAAGRSRPSVQLVGVDLTNDRLAAFAAYVTSIGLAGSRFKWTIDVDGSLARRYGVVALSSTVLVNSDGSVRFVNAGPQEAQTLSDQLQQLT